MKPLGIGIIGCGSIAMTAHIPALLEIDTGGRLVAVSDIDETRFSTLREKLGLNTCYHDYNDLLSNPLVEGVIICLPTDLHLEATVAAAKAGKHILLEKPIANTREDADQIIDVVRSYGVKLSVGHVRRLIPQYEKLKTYIDAGLLGDLFALRAEVNTDWPLEGWRSEQLRVGPGVYLDFLIHDLDSLLWLGGDIAEVYALGTRIPHRELEMETSLAAVFRFTSGALGSLTWNLSACGFGPPNFREKLEAYGTSGTVFADLKTGDLDISFRHMGIPSNLALDGLVHTNVGSTFSADAQLNRRQVFSRQLKLFVKSVVEGTDPYVTGDQAREALCVALAIAESLRTRAPVLL